ncbi:FKBP-type peptidyl-prolyl cis-trans isomerase [Qipengyuania sp. JC766]|uniref:FKBP-type peptidyl-prolyl cis-trans isomerase n=1 Tax=Qipengyuania sp. JC766 TaxID=3232139 RepID=UPI00345A7EE1
MTEVTRVPLKPIGKGTLAKMWIGIIAAVLVGAGLAWATVPPGTSITVVQAGTGPVAKEGDVVFAKYEGQLEDGTVFDQSQPTPPEIAGFFPEGTPFPVEEGASIPGFYEGLTQVQKGGTYRFEIPSDQAYGDTPQPGSPIPPGSDLTFEVEVVEIMSRADFDRRLQVLQGMMQQQMMQGQPAEGAEGGAPGTPQAPPPQPAPPQ